MLIMLISIVVTNVLVLLHVAAALVMGVVVTPTTVHTLAPIHGLADLALSDQAVAIIPVGHPQSPPDTRAINLAPIVYGPASDMCLCYPLHQRYRRVRRSL
jgi:ABC-type siderophore export system fused ATPase/permease subunit